jgi:hypothetical protein
MLQRVRSLWLRRLIVLGWVALWVGLLWAVMRPWSDLGGIVSERARWLQRLALGAGLALGTTLGGLDVFRGRLRALLYPPSLVCATSLVWFRLRGAEEAVGIAVVFWLSYTAGATGSYLELGSYGLGAGAERTLSATRSARTR